MHKNRNNKSVFSSSTGNNIFPIMENTLSELADIADVRKASFRCSIKLKHITGLLHSREVQAASLI